MVKTEITTVDEFFTWYSGEPEWKDDWQITNTMSIDAAHAQDDDYYGEKAIQRLEKYKSETITVTGNDDNVNGTWDISFELKGKTYRIQASAFFGEEGY